MLDMKLQKQISRKVAGKEYVKWVVVIPPEEIKKAKLKEGDDLKLSISKRKIKLMKK